jgi:hypothetical protein
MESDQSSHNIDRSCFVSRELKKRVRASLNWVICALDQPGTSNIPNGLMDDFVRIVNDEQFREQTRSHDSKIQVESLDLGKICNVLAKFFGLPTFRNHELQILHNVFHFLRTLRNELEHSFHIPLSDLFNSAVR